MASRYLPRNEHVAERVIRVVVGLAALSLLVVGPVPGWGLVGLLGLVPLLTGLSGTCPAYTLLGVSTRSSDGDPG